MTKITSLAELKALREKLRENIDVREMANNPEQFIQIKVAMSTCGIAAGAKEVLHHMMQKADEMGIPAIFTQTACMGFCNNEPTIEVDLPNAAPVIFSKVDNGRAEEILTKYVKNGETLPYTIPVTNQPIDK